jgi:MinD superfamily P-loop ATPase
MKEIVILSGKGGTGKTSVSGAIAHLMGQDVLLADCDVDASNLHLISGVKGSSSENFYSGYMAYLIQDKCTACGRCATICHFNAIKFEKGRFNINSLHCEGCGYCYEICPKDAVRLYKNHTGYLNVSQTRFGSTLVHARLNIGAENSGKLVSFVREKAQSIASELQSKFIVSDGSPGVGCPVIASLTGASQVLIVTEPSISALHDMERLLRLTESFNIKAACVINKFDIDTAQTEQILNYLAKINVPIWGLLPYTDTFREAVKSFRAVTELNNIEVNKEFERIVQHIKNTML